MLAIIKSSSLTADANYNSLEDEKKHYDNTCYSEFN